MRPLSKKITDAVKRFCSTVTRECTDLSTWFSYDSTKMDEVGIDIFLGH